MKVLHLISGGDTGGAKTHIINLLKELNEIIDLKMICFLEGDFYYELKDLGINIQVFPQEKRYDMSIISKLKKEIEKEDYDIIHCHGARANFIGMFLKKKVDKVFITTIHSDYKLDFEDNLYKRVLYTSLNTIALKKLDYYIAISTDFKKMLIERGFKEEEIFIVYNGIDLENEINYVSKEEFLSRYNINGEGKTIVGIMGRLDIVKDHETFIRAAKKVLESRKDVIFLIAGEGNEEKRLKSLTKELGIEEYVYFLGFVEEPYSFFNTIDINVLTSLSESFPYVILEGARFRKPIISTSVGGIKDLVVDGYNGWLAEIGDYNKIAEYITYFLNKKNKINNLGRNLYETVERDFSSRKMALDHYKIYKRIMEIRR